MADHLTETGSTSSSGGWGDAPALPVGLVKDLLSTLFKALRAHQLYDENNPVYQRFMGALTEAFRSVWSELDELALEVSEDTFTLAGEEVYRSQSRTDSLAFLFYKDGIREIVFRPGIESDEIETLLRVLERARVARSDEDDLLTLLWAEQLRNFDYAYVDLLAEGLALPSPEGGPPEETLKWVIQKELEEEEEGGAPGMIPTPTMVSMEDFNPAMYSLDEKDWEVVRTEVRAEQDRDTRRDVLSALYDRLEEAWRPRRQVEILEILESLLANFLGRGDLDVAVEVLDQVRGIRDQGRLAPPALERADALFLALSSPEILAEMVRGLRDGTLRPTPERLSGFVKHLRSDALEALLRAMAGMEDAELREVVADAAATLARDNLAALVRLLRSQDPVLAVEAARLVGRVGTDDATSTIPWLAQHSLPQVRLAAIRAATELRAASAARAVERAVEDPDRDVRVAAARGLRALGFEPAAKRLEVIVTSKELRDRDLTEKRAFMETYGALAGERAVKPLDKILNGRSLIGRREPPEVRACAAAGLGLIGSEDSKRSLEKAAADDDPLVRTAVGLALRGEEEEV